MESYVAAVTVNPLRVGIAFRDGVFEQVTETWLVTQMAPDNGTALDSVLLEHLLDQTEVVAPGKNGEAETDVRLTGPRQVVSLHIQFRMELPVDLVAVQLGRRGALEVLEPEHGMDIGRTQVGAGDHEEELGVYIRIEGLGENTHVMGRR